jgi:hypothetical protein
VKPKNLIFGSVPQAPYYLTYAISCIMQGKLNIQTTLSIDLMMFYNVWLIFLVVVVVLEFELRVLYLQSRCCTT